MISILKDIMNNMKVMEEEKNVDLEGEWNGIKRRDRRRCVKT